MRLGLASGNGFTNFEPPFPQTRLDLHKGEVNALAVHDFNLGNRGSPFACFSANSFKSTLRSGSSHVSMRRFLK
jgi:hypothetical protein